MTYYVYILRCVDQSLYIGLTTDVERRFREHQSKTLQAKYTRAHPVQSIAAYWSTSLRSDAAKLEYWLKRLNKAQKEKIILNDQYLDRYLSMHLCIQNYIREM